MESRCLLAVTITEFPVPSPAAIGLGAITRGPDGNLWFTETHTDQIGRITPAGAVSEVPVPSGGSPGAITAGPDGNLWFTEYSAGKIGRVSILRSKTQLTAAPDRSLVGHRVTFTAVVSPQPGGTAPTGSVTFLIDGAAQPPVPLAAVSGQGRASFTTTALTPGRHTVTVAYNPQGNFAGSASEALTLDGNAALPQAPATRSLALWPRAGRTVR